MTCTASHKVVHVTPTANCSSLCSGVSYSVDSIRQTGGATCRFSYSLTRQPDGKKFSGIESVGCSGSKTLTFYCDDDQTCPILQVIFVCE